jgi:hypothetical protein
VVVVAATLIATDTGGTVVVGATVAIVSGTVVATVSATVELVAESFVTLDAVEPLPHAESAKAPVATTAARRRCAPCR